jgi:hypothetical protein
MSYRVEFDAVDVQWQILMLQEFPEVANRRFYPAMQRSTKTVHSAVFPKIPHRTGLARSEFRRAVSGKGLNITGRIGFPYGIRAYYVNVLEYGAKPHEVGFVPTLGVSFQKTNRVKKQHPGVPALRFMERGQNQAQGQVNPEMERAMFEVVNDLAKKG